LSADDPDLAVAHASKPQMPATRSARSSARRKNGRPRARLDGARARDAEVIETAVRIFSQKGYASSSVQDVADALGMLKGSLYYYIDSKEDLLRKIFEDSHREITALTDSATSAAGTSADKLASFLDAYARWTLNHLERAALYSREWRYASDELRATLSEQQRYYNRRLRELVLSAQDENDLDPIVAAPLASRFIWAAFTALPDWFGAQADDPDRVIADYVSMALRAAGCRT
jgi:TetR/AcrR family transcriptional regulator, cholesterol catabolism regulator